MELKIIKLHPSDRPEASPPEKIMFELLGEEGIRKMVSDHYDLLVQSEIKHLFPPAGPGLELAKERSADFFVQRLGGPDYFNKKRGQPRLAQRHSFFSVTPEGRVEWLRCYRPVVEKLSIPDEVKEVFWTYLHDFSNWMVNSPDDSQQIYVRKGE